MYRQGTIVDVQMVKVITPPVSGRVGWYHNLILVINMKDGPPVKVNVRKSALQRNGRKRLTSQLHKKLQDHLIGKEVVIVECGNGYRLKDEKILQVEEVSSGSLF